LSAELSPPTQPTTFFPPAAGIKRRATWIPEILEQTEVAHPGKVPLSIRKWSLALQLWYQQVGGMVRRYRIVTRLAVGFLSQSCQLLDVRVISVPIVRPQSVLILDSKRES